MIGRSPLRRFFSRMASGIKHILKTSHTCIHYGRNVKLERQILHYVNMERKKHGIHTLSWDDSLYYDSQRRAREITRDFRHKNIPKSARGENIAMIPIRRNPARSFVNTWMKSSGHSENILRSSFSSSCVGIAKRGRYFYAVQLFS